MNTERDERAVLLYNLENIGEFYILGLARFVDHPALLGEEVVRKAYAEAEYCTADARDYVTGRHRLSEEADKRRTDHAWDHVTEHRSYTARRGERGSLGIVRGHRGEERSHRDIEHGIRRLIKYLKGEEADEQRNSVEQRRHRPQCDGGYREQGRSAQKPGAELSSLVLSFCERLIHKSAHHRVVYRVPYRPYDREHAHYRRVHAEKIGAVHREYARHQGERHTATEVAEHIAEPVLGVKTARLLGFFLSHFTSPS